MNSLTNSMFIVDTCNVPNLNSPARQNKQIYNSVNFSPMKTLITGLFLASCATPINALIPFNCREEDPRLNDYLAKTKALFCPKMDFDQAEGPDNLEAMKVLTNPDVQNILVDNPCPYGSPRYASYSQYSLLSLLTKQPEKKYIFEKEVISRLENFLKEFKSFSENIPQTVGVDSRFTKASLLISATNNDLNISKLFPESMISTDSTKVKLLKSITGIRLAEPGDKDVSIVFTPTVASDWNGALEMESLLIKDKKLWSEISQNHPIHFEEVSSIGEVYEVMQKVKQIYSNIKIIHFKGHGNGKSVRLDVDNSERHFLVTEKTREHVVNPNYPLFFQSEKVLPIDSDGTIIFSACSSGKGGISDPSNLVNAVALMHPGVTVLGPTRDAASSIEVIHLSKRKFSIWDLEKEKEYVTYRAQARMLQANSIYNSAMLWLSQVTGMRSLITELTEVK